MATRTIQFQYRIGGLLTDVTSVVLRDPTAGYGVRRTDTNATVVAAGTPLIRTSVGTYTYTFVEPRPGLAYLYWLEWIYDGNTKRVQQTLANVPDVIPPGLPGIPPAEWTQLGIDQVTCGDAALSAYLATQANLVWEMQARRGVTLDLAYQYFVLDLLTLAMDWVRQLIDTETGAQQMTATRYANGQGTADSASSTNRSRVYSMLSDSSGSQSFTRTATRTSSAGATGSGLSTSTRTTRGYDASYTTTTGNVDGGGATTASRSSRDTSDNYRSTTLNSGESVLTHDSTTHNWVKFGYAGGHFDTHSRNVMGLASISEQNGDVYSRHETSLSTVATDTGSGVTTHHTYIVPDASTYTDTIQDDRAVSSVRENDISRTITSTMTGTSSMAGTSSMLSSASNSNHRDATSAYHSENTLTSRTTSTSSAQRTMSGADSQIASERASKDSFSQLFASLKAMWDDTLEQIKILEQRVMLPLRYIASQLPNKTPGSPLVRQAAALTDGRLVQGPYGMGFMGISRNPNSRIIQ